MGWPTCGPVYDPVVTRETRGGWEARNKSTRSEVVLCEVLIRRDETDSGDGEMDHDMALIGFMRGRRAFVTGPR